MKNFFKKKPKINQFFHLKYSKLIGMRESAYHKIKEQLPFHSVEIAVGFALIGFNCPLKYTYNLKRYYHYGERLDYSRLIKQNSLATEFTDKYLTSYNSELSNDGDIPLPDEFNPCSLCKNELYCMFSDMKAEFEPKEYDTLYFLNILKENGYVESEELYNRFKVYYSEEFHYGGYDDMEEFRSIDVVLIFLVVFPFVLLYLPFHFVGLFIKNIFFKSDKTDKLN